MKLARALGGHLHPTMIVFPLGLMGIEPTLTFLFVGFGLVLIAGWLGGALIERLGMEVDEEMGLDDSGRLDGGPTRW